MAKTKMHKKVFGMINVQARWGNGPYEPCTIEVSGMVPKRRRKTKK